ncbi:hypothetical protein HAX54_009110 [Datura stramonium]|uniref:RING-type E3 ubiquitin transferase n=1 Tax=Datura stramonium TaxID=4076 RepID=A0ABS8RW73_DATST|nr:hypothetical protein [Datura stramonium]
MAQVVSPSTSSSNEMIAVAVIAAFPLMSILSAHKGAVKSLLSLVIVFCRSKYSTNTRKQDDNCVDHLACVICLGEVSLGESRRVLSICGHGFHTHCIDSWLKINSVCPLCRIPVPVTISMCCTKSRLVSSLISVVDNIWNWFLDPLSSEVIASLTNMECLS